MKKKIATNWNLQPLKVTQTVDEAHNRATVVIPRLTIKNFIFYAKCL